ncbi:MAG: hypothetical protein HQM08_20260 [Candidatus Riflebacteria bacterium]|nr:hypothetical protein [Candidatus Riflebacteria bacterium]
MERPIKSVPKESRHGFMFPMVVLTILVLGIFFIALSLLSRGQVQGAAHFIESSKTLEIAQTGVNWGTTIIASGTYAQQSSSVPKSFFDFLFGTTCKDSPEYAIEPPKELADYCRDLGAELTISVKIFSPKNYDPIGGFNPNPVEKYGKIEFTAKATIGRISRRVRVTRGFKVFLTVHPVLSKFTLFIKEPPSNNQLNCLVRNSTDMGFENGQPLILSNSNEPVSAVDSSIHIPTLPPFTEIVKKSGWVFLNSENSSWTINLAGSSGESGEFDDRMFLRYGKYRDDSLKSTIQIEPPSKLKDFFEQFQGLKAKFSVITGNGTIEKPASEILGIHYLFPCSPPLVSILRPFGTGSALSPTLLFGPVFRNYLRYRLIQVDIKDLNSGSIISYIPTVVPAFPSENSFADGFKNPLKTSTKDYSSDIAIFRKLYGIDPDNPSGSWPKFQQSSTELVTDSYLDGVNYLYLPGKEKGSVKEPVGVGYTNPPPNQIVDFDSWKPLSGNCLESVRKAQGTMTNVYGSVFSGGLGEIEGMKELQQKITTVFNTSEDFYTRCLSEGKLSIPGITLIKQGTLNIDTPIQVDTGGIIICLDNIVISAGITCASEPFTLISAQNISLETQEKIEAHLVCLRGTFFPHGGFYIRGGVAAQKIDFSGLLNGDQKRIEFEPSHDPFSKISWDSPSYFFRYRVSEEEEYAIEAGN